MKQRALILTVLFAAVLLGSPALADESATREECVAATKAAAKLLLADKAAGIAAIAAKDGQFVWKDSYVFLMDMQGNMLAHPFIPQLTEKGSLFHVGDKNKDNPKMIFVKFVEIAQANGEGWIGYMWPKPNSRDAINKFTYIYRVGQTDLIVGAGIYP
jgi:signal transduction histidine kinase